MYVHTYILTYIRTYVHTYIHTYLHTYVYMYICTYVHTCIHTHVHTSTYMCMCVHWYVLYLKPINGTTVDKGRKHSQSIPKGIPNRTHGQHHMKILLHSLNKQVVHRDWSSLYLTPLRDEIHGTNI